MKPPREAQQHLKNIVEAGPRPKKPRRGRTSIGKPTDPSTPTPTKPMIEQTERAESNRPIGSGSGHHRGDRRDTSPTYTGTQKHASRGGGPRKDVTTRKR